MQSHNQKDIPMNRGFSIAETTVFDPASGVTLEFHSIANDTSKCGLRLTTPGGDRLDALFDRGGQVISVTSTPADADPTAKPIAGETLDPGVPPLSGASVINTIASLLGRQPNVQARPDQGNASQAAPINPRTPVDHNSGLQSLQNEQNIAASRGEIGPLDDGFDHANPGQPHPDRKDAWTKFHDHGEPLDPQTVDEVPPEILAKNDPELTQAYLRQKQVEAGKANAVLPDAVRAQLPNAPQSKPPEDNPSRVDGRAENANVPPEDAPEIDHEPGPEIPADLPKAGSFQDNQPA